MNKKYHRIGEKHNILNGYVAEIVEYRGALDLSVKLNDGTILKKVQYWNLKNGKVANPNHLSVYGIGYLGQGKYLSRINGLDTKDYNAWNHMMQRCYRPNETQECYKGCSVVSEWHNFQVFAEWFEKNYVEGFHLDKDVLFEGNKIYGPETCCFVPAEINSMFRTMKKSKHKKGVQFVYKMNKFTARIKTSEKTRYIGAFHKEEDAHQAYLKERKKYMIELANKHKEKISINCYNTLIAS